MSHTLKMKLDKSPMELDSMNSNKYMHMRHSNFFPTRYVNVSVPGTVYVQVSKEQAAER